MATPPRPAPPPPPKPTPPPPPKPAAHHDEPNHTLNKPPDPEVHELVPLAADDPNRVVTVGEEQMERSLAYEQSLRDNGGPPAAQGVAQEEKYRARAVAGVSPTEIHAEDDHGRR